MDISMIIGLVISFGALIVAFFLEGGTPGMLVAESAALIVFGGTIGVIVISFPMETVKKLVKVLSIAFKGKKDEKEKWVSYFKNLSINTRKNGLLSLEAEITSTPNMNSFLKKGLQMVSDGTDSEVVKKTLEMKIEALHSRHKGCFAMFEAAGGFAPTLGIIGTVMGLVQVLSNLDDPSTLGPKIAVAFIATLYGVSSANLFWLPIGEKLKSIDRIEIEEMEMMGEGIMMILQGANPNAVEERLLGFLPSKVSEKMEQSSKSDNA